MPIKRSAILPLALVLGSGTLLVFNGADNNTSSKQIPAVKCCQNIRERETFTSWDIFSPTMFKTKA